MIRLSRLQHAMLPVFIVSMITLNRLQDALLQVLVYRQYDYTPSRLQDSLLPVLNLEAVSTASSSSSPSMGTTYVLQMYDTANFCYGSD
jgi:hypothetical protein